MGMYSPRGAIDLQRLHKAAGFLEDGTEARQGAKMPRVERDHPGDVIHRRAVVTGAEEGGGAGVPAFGEVRGVVGERGQMLDGGLGLARAQRVAAALQEQVHRRRAGFRPGRDHLPLHPLPALRRGVGELAQQFLDVIGSGRRTGECPGQGCRNDSIEKTAHPAHNASVARTAANARASAVTTERQTGNGMSETLKAAVEAMETKFGEGIDGTALFVIGDEGAVLVDAEGVRAAPPETDADVTLTASVETFRAILDGDLSPTVAFMSGRLAVTGNLGLAMRLGTMMS
jgi:putative sterol carrier protein